MIAKFRETILWQYGDRTTIMTLMRHRHWVIGIMYGWTASGMLMMSSLVEMFISPIGTLRDISIVLCILSSVVGILLTIPAICAIPWSHDINRALNNRGFDFLSLDSLSMRICTAVVKMILWASIAVFVSN